LPGQNVHTEDPRQVATNQHAGSPALAKLGAVWT
jgi:hypothetical protein